MKGVIPEFDVDIKIAYDPAAPHADLTAEEVAAGFTDHHDYFPIPPVGWAHVEDCMEWEANLLAAAAASDAQDGPDWILDEIAEADDDSDYLHYMSLASGLDLGVITLVMALAAAGTATFYSCAAGLDHRHHARYPTVGVVTDAERGRLIAELAQMNGCGVSQGGGRLYIYAATVTRLHDLGCAILDRSADFDQLRPPAWSAGLSEALSQLEDG